MSSSSSVALGVIDGPVELYWEVPDARENGDHLDITEIGGYELRYKRKADSNYTRVQIADAYIDTYYFDYLQGEYQFEIAVYDKNGLYSNYVVISPQ